MASPNLAIIIVLIFIGAFIWFIIWLMRWQRNKVWNHMGLIADFVNIELPGREEKKFMKPLPYLSGKYKNRTLSIHSEMRGSGKHRHYVTILRLAANAHSDNTITIWREGFFSKIGKALGMQDIQTGFEEFDKKFILRSNNPDFAMKVMNQKVCDKFVEMQKQVQSNLYFDKGNFSYTESMLILNDKIRERYLSTIELFTLLAERVEGLPLG